MNYLKKHPMIWFWLAIFISFIHQSPVGSIIRHWPVLLSFVIPALLVTIFSFLSAFKNKNWIIKAISIILMVWTGVILLASIGFCLSLRSYCNPLSKIQLQFQG